MTDFVITSEPTTRENKKEAKKMYMREYMRNRYRNNPQQGAAQRKTNRAKRGKKIPLDETDKYGVCLGHAIKCREFLQVIKEIKPEILRELFAEFVPVLDV